MKVIQNTSCIALALLFMLMSGCSYISLPSKFSNNQITDDTRKHLQEKYNESFVVDNIGDRIDTNHTKMYVHPTSNNDIKFTVLVDDDSNEFKDDYVIQKNNHKVNEIVNECFLKENVTALCKSSIVFGETFNIPDKDYTPLELIEQVNTDHYTIYIIFDKNSYDGNIVGDILINSAKEIGVDLVFLGYVFTSADYDKCKSQMNKYPEANSTTIENNNPVSSFTGTVNNEKIKITSGNLNF